MCDVIPRQYDLSLDPTSQKMRSREDIRDILDMTDASKMNLTPPLGNAKRIRGIS